jgi:hypothetical protein
MGALRIPHGGTTQESRHAFFRHNLNLTTTTYCLAPCRVAMGT